MEYTLINSLEKSAVHCQLFNLRGQINPSQCFGNVGSAALWCSRLQSWNLFGILLHTSWLEVRATFLKEPGVVCVWDTGMSRFKSQHIWRQSSTKQKWNTTCYPAERWKIASGLLALADWYSNIYNCVFKQRWVLIETFPPQITRR